jgi:Fur family transcriptional regulator, peroxide stress response regulator
MESQWKLSVQGALRRWSLRLTPQRYAVLECLMRHRGHPTADQIYMAVNASDPRASRATVYNNLHALIRAGAIREVVLESGPARYDANIERHHHFICARCGGLEDITGFDVPELLKLSRLGSRRVQNYEIVFRGVCGRCSKGPAPNSRTGGNIHGQSCQTNGRAGGRRR